MKLQTLGGGPKGAKRVATQYLRLARAAGVEWDTMAEQETGLVGSRLSRWD